MGGLHGRACHLHVVSLACAYLCTCRSVLVLDALPARARPALACAYAPHAFILHCIALHRCPTLLLHALPASLTLNDVTMAMQRWVCSLRPRLGAHTRSARLFAGLCSMASPSPARVRAPHGWLPSLSLQAEASPAIAQARQAAHVGHQFHLTGLAPT